MIALPSNLALKLVAGLCAVLALALLVQDRNRWKAKAGHYAGLVSAERSAHAASVANYRAAVERARREDAENVARIKAEQAVINERTANDYESRIAAARARSDELRRQARVADADRGSRAAAPVPRVPATAEGAARAAGEDRLPDADRLLATEQAIQLDELIKWVKAQAQVRTEGN